ncbi:hypothetical protein RN001_012411 [Aquatica leii]|uniref:Peptidoglycan-recognition protein n=1 Tax=Aquatica leii TaxID=1421715 RepID=A0AAN7PSV1_9COLE|nr:hypothetical protein RN001_012411 [Aquatica leii]
MQNFSVLLFLVISTFSLIFADTETDYPAVCPEIVSKNEWGARGALKVEYSVYPLDYVIIHHTVTPECHDLLRCSDLLKSMQNYHMDSHKFHDIGYNFVIGGDGKVYEGRGWHKVGAHTKGYNTRSLGIAFIGNFINKLPNEQQLQAGKDLIQCAEELQELDYHYKLHGARQVSATQSPGLTLYHEIQNWPHFSKRI